MMIYSKFRFWAIFFIICLNLSSGFLLYLLIKAFVFSSESSAGYLSIGNCVMILFVILLELVTLAALVVDCRKIKIDKDAIVLTNLVFPFIRKRIRWEDLDCYGVLAERARSKDYEAIWLIKEEKVKIRISSFYYSNYGALKEKLQLKSRGRINVGIIRMLICSLGLTKVPRKKKKVANN